MLQSVTYAWVLVLLWVTAVEAQPRSLRGRSVTLARKPGEPPPEVHVAASILTVLLFDAPIDKASVQLDTTRFELMDVGERSLIIVPIVSPSEQERWVLRVRYADGAQPEWATFALISRPPEVDARIDVVRQPQSLAACEAELADALARREGARAEVWVLADRLGGSTGWAHTTTPEPPKGPANLVPLRGTVYQLATGLLLVFPVQNAAGQPPWAPTEGTLRGDNGALVPVRTVAVRPGQIAPGEEGQVAVETELPQPEAGTAFTLELRDASGQGLTFEGELPAAPAKKGGGQ